VGMNRDMNNKDASQDASQDTSKKPRFAAELHRLCGKLRDGEITDTESDRLDEMLRSSADARRFYRMFMALTSALESRAALQDAADQDASAQSNTALLSELLEMEQAAEEFALPAQPRPVAAQAADRRGEDRLGWREIAGATGYLLGRAMVSRPARYAYGALLLVSAMLTIAIIASTGSGPTTADNSNGVDPPADRFAPPTAVATLTADHEAQWAAFNPAPGDTLYAGQRLTLTEGFAEVTTHRGAVAVLEAPATFELIDHENALHLHAGKLVGICESERSQGFVVRTPHMEVTDLGTRFGVDLAERQAEVHVIEGSVSLSRQRRGGDAVFREQLTAGQAAAYRTSGGLAQVAFDANRFIADMREAALRPDFAGTNAVWKGALSGELGQDKRQDDALQVFIERQGLVLTQPVAVDMRPGRAWDVINGIGNEQVPAGERLDVYLLHLDLLDGHDSAEAFTIDFGRPIIGVIGSQTHLDGSDASLGVAGVSYPRLLAPSSGTAQQGGPRGINARLLDGDQIDTLSIAEDGQTLRLKLWGGDGSSMDQVRVLVESADGDGF